MEDTPLHVLLVQDDATDGGQIEPMLADAAADVVIEPVGCLSAVLEHLARQEIDVILLDLSWPHDQGLATLEAICAQAPHVPVVALVPDDPDLASKAIHRGAQSYLVQGRFDSSLLVHTLRCAVERKQARLSLAWEASVNAAIADLAGALIQTSSLDDISYLVLEHAKHLTSSRFGFVGYVDPRTGYFVSSTLTRDIWEACRIQDKQAVFTKYTGLWGWVLENRRPLLTNSPAGDPRSSGTPPGHIPIERFLAAPALLGETLVGQIALANPPRDYTPQDLALIERLAALYALAIQRSRAEEQQRLQSAALEAAANAIVITDHEGHIEWVNPAFTHLTGYTPDEVRGQNPRLLKSGAHGQEFYQDLWQTILAGRVWHGEMVNRRKDGRLYTEEMTITPVRDEQGKITHFIAVKQDVTQRKEAESQREAAFEALRASEARFRALLESAPDVVVLVDAGGRITLINAQVEETFGYVEEELLGQPIELLVPGRLRAMHRQHRAGYLTQPRTRPMGSGLDIVARRKDGSEFPADIKLSPIEIGTELFVIAIVRDISERKRAEDALRRYAGEQSALYAVTSAITSILDLDRLLPTILEVVLPVLAADAGWIILADSAADARLRLVAWCGISTAALEQIAARSVEDCLACRPFLHHNKGGDASHLIVNCPSLPADLSEREGLGSWACIPLAVGDTVLGLLTIAWQEKRGDLEAEEELLTAIGRQVGLALHNARLYQTARQVDRLQVLNQLDQALAATLDLETVVEITLQQVAAALDVPLGALVILPSSEVSKSCTLRIFTLDRGWIAVTLSAQNEQQQAILQQMQSNPDVRPLSGDELVAAGAPSDLSQRWGPHGLLLPVQAGEKLVAVMALGGRPLDRPFTDEDRALAQAVVSRAGQAIQNAWLYRLSQEQTARLATLNAISTTIASSLDMDVVVSRILEMACQALDADGGSILLRDPATDELIFVRTLGDEADRLKGRRLQPGEGLAGWIVQHDQALRVDDVRQDPRFYVDLSRVTGLEVRSLLGAPLKHRQRIIGVIEVFNKRHGLFSAEDQSLLEAIAPAAAISLENARLYKEQKELLREREEIQAQLIHSEKMAALGRLAASIAHEINNPLQSVQGCLTLAEEELAEDMPRRDKLDLYLNMAGSEIDRIAEIVRRMRDFYRPAGKGMQSTDLHSVLDNVLALTDKQLQHGKVIVVRDWTAGLPLIQANPDHLKQVFLNLVLNAIDAMPEGGTLRIGTSLGRLPAGGKQPAQAAVCIEFSDTGHGMSATVLGHLFEPFFTTKETGSGLGLYISYGIIAAHGGQIRVESQEGQGTTFTLWLPVEKVANGKWGNYRQLPYQPLLEEGS